MPRENGRGMNDGDGAAVTLIDGNRALRRVLGRFATGVTVITTAHHGHKVGVTVNSFTSVSLRPPLILWCLHQDSATRAAFMAAEHFAVNVLAGDQQEMAIRFASRGERFDGIPVREGQFGLPLLEGTVASIICRRTRALRSGDHIVLIGSVLAHRADTGPPLLFIDGSYRKSGHIPSLLSVAAQELTLPAWLSSEKGTGQRNIPGQDIQS